MVLSNLERFVSKNNLNDFLATKLTQILYMYVVKNIYSFFQNT